MSSSPLFDNPQNNHETSASFLEQSFLVFVKQELAKNLSDKDILVYEVIKQLENNNINSFEVFQELDTDDIVEILDSLISIDENLKQTMLLQLKLLVNMVRDEFTKINKDQDVHEKQVFEFFLQLESKLDQAVLQFDDFKQKLFKELSSNRDTDKTSSSPEAATPSQLKPAVSMTTLTPYHATKQQPSSSNLQPQINTPSSDEPFKQMKASKQDSSQKILMNAMIKHNIPLSKLNDYVLIISYQDKEIVMTSEDKPVEIFKSLKKNGYQPAIMLREIDKESARISEQGDETPGGRL